MVASEVKSDLHRFATLKLWQHELIKSHQNPAIWLQAPLSAKVADHAVPKITDPTDVIIRINYIGTCGSDVHFWTEGGIGDALVSKEQPLVMGHEASGTVHDVGSAVTRVKSGDRVALEPGFPCRQCPRCKEGRYNLCPDMVFAASPPDAHGVLCKYFKLPGDFVYKLPDHVSLEEGVLVEPTAVAVHMIRLVNVGVGDDSVVIFGAGSVGLLCATVAKAYGVKKIVLVDILEKKLEFAKSFVKGCETYLSEKGKSAQENAQEIKERFSLGGGADVVLEATGAEPCICAGIYVVRPGGRYVQGGLGQQECKFPMGIMVMKELVVRGATRYFGGDFKIALDLISEGKISVKELISKKFDFEHATDAWETTKKGEGIKNLIHGVKD